MLNQTLLNRYKITAALGKGAMGEVYAALDRQTGQMVALKVIVPGLSQDAELLQRFRREGEALRQLRHRNIVGFGEMFAWQGQQVIVMEYVPGGSLYARLKQGPLPLARVREVALDLCDALVSAHRLDIIHRDLKPENVLLTESGLPKLTDFGVARLMGEGTRLTSTGTQVGTPYYMSPEAWAGRPLDAQTDIWSLGVMLFEMLAGRPPFGGETVAAVMNSVLTAPVPDLKALRPDTPDDLVQVVRRALNRDLTQRYKTMRQMAVDIEQCSVPSLTSEEQERWSAEKKALAAAAGDSRSTQLKSAAPRRWRLWAVGGAALAAVVCLLAGAGLLWWWLIFTGSKGLAPAASPTPGATRVVEVTSTAPPLQPQTAIPVPAGSTSPAGPTAAAGKATARPAATSRPTLSPTATEAGPLTLSPISVDNAAGLQEIGKIKDIRGGVVWSPDGKYLAGCGSQGPGGSTLYDTQTLQVVRTLGTENAAVCAFLPDSSGLVAAGSAVKLLDVATGGEKQTFGDLKDIREIALSGDGTLLALREGDLVKVWDVAANKQVAMWPAPNTRLLAFSPDGKQLASANSSDVVLAEAATGKVTATLKGHGSGVIQLRFSADGRWLASASWDKTARLWDATSGQLVSTFTGHADAVTDAAISPDGTVVATVSRDLTAKVWEAASGKLLSTLVGNTQAVAAVAFSPDAARLATLDDSWTVRVWGVPAGGGAAAAWPAAQPVPTALPLAAQAISVDNAASVQEIGTIKDIRGGVVWSPDGKYLAACGAPGSGGSALFDAQTLQEVRRLGTENASACVFLPDSSGLVTTGSAVKLLDVTTGGEKQTFGDLKDIREIALSGDGTLLALRDGDLVKIWDVAANRQVAMWPTPNIRLLAFSPDGKQLAMANSSDVVLAEAATGKVTATLKGHGSGVIQLHFSADGRWLASASWDKTARLWDAATGKLVSTFSGHTDAVTGAAVSPDGTVVATVARDLTVKLWEAASGKLLSTLVGHTQTVAGVNFSPDGARLATLDDYGMVRVWGVPAGGGAAAAAWPAAQPVPTALPLAAQAISLGNAASVQETGTIKDVRGGAVWSPDGKYLAACGAPGSGGSALYDAQTLQVVRTLGTENASACVFLPDGSGLVTTGSSVKLLDVATGGEKQTFGDLKDIREITLSGDGTLLALRDGQVVKIWDVAANRQVAMWPAPNTGQLAFSPDGKQVATANSSDIYLAEAATGKVTTTLKGHTSMVIQLRFSADGRWLASAGWDKTARLWEAGSGRLVSTFTGHTDAVTGVAVSPDGTVVATVSRDLMVKLWEAASGKLLMSLTGHTQAVAGVSFSPDGARLATLDDGGTVVIWTASR